MIADVPGGLRVWPTPVGAGQWLRVELAAPLAAPGFPASDLDVTIFDLQGRRMATLARGPVAARNGVIELEWNPASSGLSIDDEVDLLHTLKRPREGIT